MTDLRDFDAQRRRIVRRITLLTWSLWGAVAVLALGGGALLAWLLSRHIALPLARSVALAGNSAIPMVKELTALVSRSDSEAGRFVHWGATSQDAMDTGLVLQLREALERSTLQRFVKTEEMAGV